MVRVIAKMMKIMTGHKIKTSVQSWKIMMGKYVNYIVEEQQQKSWQEVHHTVKFQQNSYLPLNFINKKRMRGFKNLKRPRNKHKNDLFRLKTLKWSEDPFPVTSHNFPKSNDLKIQIWWVSSLLKIF